MASDDTADRMKIDRRPAQHRREWELFQLLDQVPVGVFVADSAGKPYYANAQARALLGMATVPDHVDRFSEVYQAFEIGTDQPYPVERLPLIRARLMQPPQRRFDPNVDGSSRCQTGRGSHRRVPTAVRGDFLQTLVVTKTRDESTWRG